MRILYIFPHPDDESFGPAAVMHRQREEGHEVHLLTLTRGGATKVRHALGLSVAAMGEVRLEEMRAVERTLDLTSMTVWDFEDSGLKNMDPRILEREIAGFVRELRPDVLVTYAVHGISGFHDHLVTHAVVKRVYLELRDAAVPLLRLGLLTVPDSGEATFIDGRIRLKHSMEAEIDCSVPLRAQDIDAMKRALACYATYQATIEDSGVVEKVGTRLHFEFFGESVSPPVEDLLEGLVASAH
ncbi:MAG: PIG-L family deacetylase [Bacteroidota bacterium]|nr:PIG-L family deacetylase [Bacteroidota bacterium]